jgi:hypothetical protein
MEEEGEEGEKQEISPEDAKLLMEVKREGEECRKDEKVVGAVRRPKARSPLEGEEARKGEAERKEAENRMEAARRKAVLPTGRFLGRLNQKWPNKK